MTAQPHSTFGGEVEIVFEDGRSVIAQCNVSHEGHGALFFPADGLSPDSDSTEFTARFLRGDDVRLRWVAQSDTPRGTLVLVERVP